MNVRKKVKHIDESIEAPQASKTRFDYLIASTPSKYI